MKKIININLSSRLIPIEDSAYELLRQYLDSLRRYFSKEEGAEEIIGDIESRIAEVFQDLIKKGAHCITDQDVMNIKASMGTPEQLSEEEEKLEQKHQQQQQQTETPYAHYIRPRKRFYRDPDGKVLGGVCSGLGAYFNIDPLVFRIIFAVAAIGLWGGGIVLYFILWFATGEAITAAEKLEMRGERVDLNNIKATVQEEMNSFRTRFEGMSNDVRNFSEGRGKQFGRDAGSAIEGFFRGLARAVAYIAKGFFLFLAVVMLFVLVVGLFVSAIFSAVLMPIKDLLLDSGAQTVLFWPALALLIGIPILSLVMFLVRKMTGIKQQNKFTGYTLGFFWLLGVVFSIWLGVSVARDFRTRVPAEPEMISITQPAFGKLIVKKAESLVEMDNVDFFDGHLRILDDTVVIDDIDIKVVKSETDSFQVELQRYSRGRTFGDAREYAAQIKADIRQKDDSVLYIPDGFSIPRHSKYRNQQITILIKVPEGKDVQIDRELWHRNYRFTRNWRDEEWWDDRGDWDGQPVDIHVTPNGLERRDRRLEREKERAEREKERMEREREKREQEKKENEVAPPADTANPRKEYRYRGNDQQNVTPADDSSSKGTRTGGASTTLSFISFLFQNSFKNFGQ